jgi:hypothetical protein
MAETPGAGTIIKGDIVAPIV